MKRSYKFEAKRRYHDELLRFASRVFPRGRRKLKLLNFPGSEGLENRRWLDFGIRPENQFGVEHDTRTYEELASHNFGINIFFGELLDFLDGAKAEGTKFDIVNLDYEGPVTTGRIEDISALSLKGVLNNPCILATTFLAKRESKDIQRLYRDVGRETHLFFQDLDEEAAKRDPRYFDVLKGYRELPDAISSLRDDVIPALLTMLIRMCPPDQLYERLKRKGFFDYFALPYNRHIQFREDEESFRKEFIESKAARSPLTMFFELLTYKEMQRHPLLQWLPATDIPLFHRYLMDSVIRGFLIRDSFKGEYRSRRSGTAITPMYFDILWLEKPAVYHPSFFDFHFAHGDRFELDVGHDFGVGRVRVRKFEAYAKYVQNEVDYVDKNRIDISSDIPTTRRSISKRKAIALLRDGTSIDQILESYRGFTRGQLAAHKAHITMGTYGPAIEETAQAQSELEIPEPDVSTENRYSVRSMLSRDKYRKSLREFSENVRLRMQYFIDDLFSLGLNDDQIHQMLLNIKESEWYENREPKDVQVYSFFDDLTLCARNNYIPDANSIKGIYESALTDGIDPKVRQFVTQQVIPEIRKLTKGYVGRRMMEVIKQKSIVYPTDIAETADEVPIVAMLMTNWYKENQSNLKRRKNRFNGMYAFRSKVS